jgi:phage tail sheath protein FI
MAVNLVSPGVKITEADLVSSVPSSGATVGAVVGDFRWGPIEQPVLVANESELVATFGSPNSTTIVDFLTATNYLAYSAALQVVRAANTTAAKNATSEATTGGGGDGTGALFRNDDEYTKNALDVSWAGDDGPWVAKHAGALGNSLKVSVCPSAAAWSKTLTGTWAILQTANTATSVDGAATNEVAVGDVITIGTNELKVASVTNANTIVFTSSAATAATSNTVVRNWEYQAAFDAAPGTTTSAASKNASNDEVHIVVVDEDGLITGNKGAVLEKYAGVSKAVDGRTTDGSTNYYKDVINNRSKYVRWLEHDDFASNWGSALVNPTTGVPTVYAEIKTKVGSYSFAGGVDATPTAGNKQTCFSLFSNKETYDISVLIAGDANAALVNHVIAIAESRKDCMVCFSPQKADVVNDAGDEVANISAFAATITRSNYAVMDSGWKYQYNKYADNYVWVPLNADIAGCLARVDGERGPWFSPAGYSQGRILNAVKLAWNPDQNARDALYKNAINPVVNQPGRGTILFGDKTFVTKPGSFSRINVRRLFLTIEKAIGTLSSNLLFELNDPATRAGFVNTVEPYLRNIVAQRGIEQFVVVCNETNNGEDVVNSNSFVADFYIRPVFSINFIQLNFVSVAGAAAFSAIGG